MPGMTDREAFDQWIDELPTEDQMIVLQRALVQRGWSHTLGDDGAVVVDDEFEEEDELFQACLHEQYTKMYWQDAIEELLDEGLVEPDGVNEDGSVNYVVVAE